MLTENYWEAEKLENKKQSFPRIFIKIKFKYLQRKLNVKVNQ